MELFKHRMFFDMDGTLNVFDPEAGPDRYTAKGYFKNRPPIKTMVDTVNELIDEGVEVFIISSVFQDDHSIDEKNDWINRMFGAMRIPYKKRIYVPYGISKSGYLKKLGIAIEKTDILVDDYNPNLFDWPGIAVKVLNGINGNSNEWEGYFIDHRSKMNSNILRGIQKVSA